ncbi:MAG: integrase arm-type DNA-binding domain-containing protein, partial [Alphaproteobacteria bacterium]|nr:integrase arm-type DNA-binding domain-containing protein [Alphaproteobacteria bacterium]
MPKLADKPLSDARLRKLKPSSKRYEVPDGMVRGMSVRVSPAGTMTFFQTSRDQFGKRTRVKLGRYPDISLKDARADAIQTRKEIEAGTYLDRHKPRLFSEVSNLWLDRDQAGNRSINNVRSAINVHVLPKFGDRPIDSITRADIHLHLDEITDNGTPVQANRVYA